MHPHQNDGFYTECERALPVHPIQSLNESIYVVSQQIQIIRHQMRQNWDEVKPKFRALEKDFESLDKNSLEYAELRTQYEDVCSRYLERRTILKEELVTLLEKKKTDYARLRACIQHERDLQEDDSNADNESIASVVSVSSEWATDTTDESVDLM